MTFIKGTKFVNLQKGYGVVVTTPEWEIVIGHGISVKNITKEPIEMNTMVGKKTFSPEVGVSLIMPK